MSGMCRNAGYWSNADQFDPDRFPVDGPIPNEVTEVYNYLPFGGGRRKCIGEPAAPEAHTLLIVRNSGIVPKERNMIKLKLCSFKRLLRVL